MRRTILSRIIFTRHFHGDTFFGPDPGGPGIAEGASLGGGFQECTLPSMGHGTTAATLEQLPVNSFKQQESYPFGLTRMACKIQSPPRVDPPLSNMRHFTCNCGKLVMRVAVSPMPSPEWQVAKGVVEDCTTLPWHSLSDALPNPPWNSPIPALTSWCMSSSS